MANGHYYFRTTAAAGADDAAITWATALEITNDSDVIFFDDDGSTEGMRWDASSNRLGIGAPNPDYKLVVKGPDSHLRIKIESTAANSTSGIYFLSNGGGAGATLRDDRANARFEFLGGTKYYFDNIVLIGDTAESSGSMDSIKRLQVTGAEAVMGIKNTTATDSSVRSSIVFTDNGNTARGYIGVNNAATSYNTSSDISLKTDFEPIHDAAGRVMDLNPTQFKWLDNGNISEGFVAQEVAQDEQLAKDVVSGEDGSMVMDYGRITPLLTAALQNALKRIDELEKELKNIKE